MLPCTLYCRLQQSTNSQYSASLAWVLDLFLRLHPDYRSLRDCAATRASIVELQLAVRRSPGCWRRLSRLLHLHWVLPAAC